MGPKNNANNRETSSSQQSITSFGANEDAQPLWAKKMEEKILGRLHEVTETLTNQGKQILDLKSDTDKSQGLVALCALSGSKTEKQS